MIHNSHHFRRELPPAEMVADTAALVRIYILPECNRAPVGSKSKSAAARLVEWLRVAAPATSAAAEMCNLVVAAAVPGVPARQALLLLLEADAFDAVDKERRGTLATSDVLAGLAVGLPQAHASAHAATRAT